MKKMKDAFKKKNSRGGIFVGGVELNSEIEIERLLSTTEKEEAVIENRRGKRWIRIMLDNGEIDEMPYSHYLYIFSDGIILSVIFINPLEKNPEEKSLEELFVSETRGFLSERLPDTSATFFEKRFKFITGEAPLGIQSIGKTRRILFQSNTFWVKEIKDEDFYDFIIFCHREYLKDSLEKKLEKLYSLLSSSSFNIVEEDIIRIIKTIKKEKQTFYSEFSFQDDFFFLKKEEDAKFLLNASLLKESQKRSEDMLKAVTELKKGIERFENIFKYTGILMYTGISVGIFLLLSFPWNLIFAGISGILIGTGYFYILKTPRRNGDKDKG